jgi:hypothetical protein
MAYAWLPAALIRAKCLRIRLVKGLVLDKQGPATLWPVRICAAPRITLERRQV